MDAVQFEAAASTEAVDSAMMDAEAEASHAILASLDSLRLSEETLEPEDQSLEPDGEEKTVEVLIKRWTGPVPHCFDPLATAAMLEAKAMPNEGC